MFVFLFSFSPSTHSLCSGLRPTSKSNVVRNDDARREKSFFFVQNTLVLSVRFVHKYIVLLSFKKKKKN